MRSLASGEEAWVCHFAVELVEGRVPDPLLPELTAGFATDPGRAADRVARLAALLLEILAHAHSRGVMPHATSSHPT